MPIRPENRWLYPVDWPQLSDTIRFGRAKGCCEGCGRPHGQIVFHLGDGRWWDATAQTWRNGRGRPLKLAPLECLPGGTVLATTRVSLACAHLDHDPGTTLRPTSGRYASAVACYMIAPSICASVGSPTVIVGPSVTCSSGPTRSGTEIVHRSGWLAESG